MANGNGPCVKCYALLGLVVVVVLAITGVWNPFPGVWEWVNRSQPLAEPAAAWQQRLGSSVQSVTFADSAVVVEHRTTVEALSVSAGVPLWEKNADWAAVAGSGRSAVVAVGELLVKGYEVLDPASGSVLRRDSAAMAVWTYRNLLLDVRCRQARDCQLTAWEPRGSQPLWVAPLPGVGTVLFADNPELPTTRPLTTRRVKADAADPQPAPALLGFEADGKLHVVDTATGRVVQAVAGDRGDRLVVVGGRVLTVSARAQDGTCYFTTTATDPATGQVVWQRVGLNLRTASGAGCTQRQNPSGGQNVVLGVTPEGDELLVDAYDGRELWRGAPGEKVLAVDDRYALVRSAGGDTVTGHPLGARRAAWTRAVDEDAQAGLTPYAALVLPDDPKEIVAVRPADGAVLAGLRSTAQVYAVGPTGMIIGAGRDLGYVPFVGAAPQGGPAPPPADPDVPCGGPKEPSCPTGGGG